MRVTVLGSSASYAGPGEACAGHLVQAGEARLLMDCGNGVLANLGRLIDPLTLDAVFVTHAHVDHFADLFALQALLRYAPQGPADPLPLYLPEGLLGRMKCLLGDHAAEELEAAFLMHEHRDGESVRVGSVAVTPTVVDHIEASFALVVEEDGRRVCYSGDSKSGEALLEAARGAHLLIAEATLPQAYAGRAAHMTAAEAGALAREASVSRLVLAHVWPTNDREAMAREATKTFGKPVPVASALDAYDVE